MLGTYIFGGSVVTILLAMVIISFTGFMFWKLACSFVNDNKFTPPKFIKKFWESECFGEWDRFVGYMVIFLFMILVIVILWPLAVIVGSVWGTLHLLRFLFRVKKKLGKLGCFAHGHPDSVEKTSFEG